MDYSTNTITAPTPPIIFGGAIWQTTKYNGAATLY